MMYGELLKRFDNGDKLPLLDPIEDMEIESQDIKELIKAKDKINVELDKVQNITQQQ